MAGSRARSSIPSMAKSLNCPSCGAAAAGPEATRCEHCASTLTSMGCPACFGVMFAGMQFCPHCGAKGERVTNDGATLSCPGCSSDMKAATVGTTSLSECSVCASTWLDADTFRRLCLDREQRGAIAVLVGSGVVEKSRPKPGAVRYVPCPLCTQVMNRENFGKRSGVIIDVCKGHGVWFEPRELHSVMAFIDRGGLERSRALDAESKKAEARAEQKLREGARDAVVGRTGETQKGMFRSSSSSSSSSLGESILDEALRMLFS